ncbi:uncharacterized protein A4U43_C07F31300 [Asparagus officinalis]|uniref:MADS-box domain-containing protein n=1 Tax=Asparagus officinalis TaxID=4686 RepID=A0A5P1EGB6_ASPOF|nr:agamous-like MADS-box protein AGL23 [Asparagus officinalis]ONK64902.1 uncharacterized protein A4U43_C07F31300 [Asparagus officinalis]
MARKKKTTMGKQKIEIKRLESEDARHVCFSKRKVGIFSKASELATLCGARVAVLLESPVGWPHSFGSPNMGQVADQYLSGRNDYYLGLNEAQRLSKVQELNKQCMEISAQLDAAKKKKAHFEEKLEKIVEVNEFARKCEHLEELSLAELVEMEKVLYELRENIRFKIFRDMTMNQGATSSTNVNANMMLNPFENGGNHGMMVNLFEHQTGLSENPFTMNFSDLGANQSGSSTGQGNPADNVSLNEPEPSQPATNDTMGPGHGFY